MKVPVPSPAAPAAEAAERIAARLDVPRPATDPWMDQSLAQGAAGTALLHIERAHTGRGTWQHAHRWVTAVAATQISAADTTGLFLGAPAVAFVLRAASGSDRYAEALAALDEHVAELAHRRSRAAMARIGRGELSTFGEYDVFYGLTGIGAYLLRSAPEGNALESVLRYLVALTRPMPGEFEGRPGWWVSHDPHRGSSAHFAQGHGNLGVAHGITGPLLLLSQAQRRGVTVDGQAEAIETVCGHLERWCQPGERGPWWPEHLTVHDLGEGVPRQPGPARPSWCYGTPGIARAGQLAAAALGDRDRQAFFENALDLCLSDPEQMSRVTDAGLCHGWAGVYQTVWRTARDAATPGLDRHLAGLADRLVEHVDRRPGTDDFLEGDAGAALALMTAERGTDPESGWDSCLLID
ncbi:lanthionine synthetase C family protein [Nocardiopsis sp. CNT312]|uniref:lanthionine synthetase C family protein n=1 Tax=Nocardiopsis sp. CNT312 TaxID=1137268 RepID=UPI0004B38AAC|nr:lanthionine synthetase C family protein [Nocardiopsis sp. CNT312]